MLVRILTIAEEAHSDPCVFPTRAGSSTIYISRRDKDRGGRHEEKRARGLPRYVRYVPGEL